MESVCGRRVLGSTRLLKAFAEARNLPLGARLCYLLMTAYGRDSGECYASAATLARVLGISRRAVKRYWQILRRQGWLASKRVAGKVSHHTFPWHALYALASPGGGDTIVPTGGTKAAPGGDTAVPQMYRTYTEGGGSSMTAAALEEGVRQHIWGYFQGERRAQVPPPDRDIVRRCVAALHGHSVEELERLLRRLWREGAQPGRASGPRGYAWFPRVLENAFGPR